MQPQNDYLIVQPVKEGLIQAEGNEYLVVEAEVRSVEDPHQNAGFGEFKNYYPGDTVIVEDHFVIRVLVGGKETFFVKEENVLARIYGPQKDN
ncbi:MAG: hypothetical protein WC750_06200 [Patescibacteria group bacterium]|jgi:co-chaperonin GroES (HSP10)